ncbi:MAG: hypothetical protein ACT4NV_17075 [Rhodoferax sp.]
MDKKDKEPKLWVTVLKLIVGLVVIIGGTGAILKWAAQFDSEPPVQTGPAGLSDWGISRDSPIRQKR